jgi:2-hydroxy-3-keto-5-methylthiopentenyl-1-phosphate phosphatase
MKFHPQHWQQQRPYLVILEALDILQSLRASKVSVSLFAKKYMTQYCTQQNNALFVFSHAYVPRSVETFANFRFRCKKKQMQVGWTSF